MKTFETLDLIVVIIYLIGIFTLAYFSGKKKESKDIVSEQYLAGKSLTFFESLFSIIATEVSALTFLGIPAIAFGGNYNFIQIYMGALFGRLAIAFIMLPKVYDKGTTVYSVMAKGGDLLGQRGVALFYSLNKFLAVGVRLFSGSILVAEFFQVHVLFAVAIISLITFFYTMIGGLKAVVRTDAIQMFLFVGGGVLAHYLIPQVDGRSWSEMMGVALDAGKMSFFDMSQPSSFVIGLLGGFLFDMCTHGVDQDFVQRLTANKSFKSAQRAIILSTFLSISIGFLFLGVGSLLWSYAQVNTIPEMGNDKVFAYFITQYFPTGVVGLMVAGVLAATMSTLDSTINALSSCLYVDIFHHETKNQSKISFFYKRDTLFISIGLLVVAMLASTSSGLLMLGLKLTSWTAGPLLALFFGTLVFKKMRLTLPVVLASYALGVFGVYLAQFVFTLNWNFNVYFGFVLGTVGGMLAMFLTKERPVDTLEK